MGGAERKGEGHRSRPTGRQAETSSLSPGPQEEFWSFPSFKDTKGFEEGVGSDLIRIKR